MIYQTVKENIKRIYRADVKSEADVLDGSLLLNTRRRSEYRWAAKLTMDATKLLSIMQIVGD